ncbi:MAG: Rpn family recombination-promoting nuclease/putative transposase [Spirochaetota bacterium]
MRGENIHDKYFKSVFGETKNTIDFLENYLPQELLQEIDLATLELAKETFVDETLQEKFSDILYRANRNNKTTYIYTLFDHKSRAERFTAFQVLQYIVAIWNRHLRQIKKGKHLPLIIPIIIYHGKNKWKYPKDLHSLLQIPSVFKNYIPNFQFLLYDLSQYKQSEITGQTTLKLSLLLMKYIFHPELVNELPRIFSLLSQIEGEEESKRAINQCLQYLHRGSDKISLDRLKKEAETIPNEGVQQIMPTIAETLEKQGFEKGEKVGFTKGEEVGLKMGLAKGERLARRTALQTAISLKKEGFDFVFIHKMTKLDLNYLQLFFTKAHSLGIHF